MTNIFFSIAHYGIVLKYLLVDTWTAVIVLCIYFHNSIVMTEYIGISLIARPAISSKARPPIGETLVRQSGCTMFLAASLEAALKRALLCLILHSKHESSLIP